jgi:hypothetical protein
MVVRKTSCIPDEQSGHGLFVEGWLRGTANSPSPAQLITLFERAFDALWQRAQRTLGEVTLMAIGDRVLYVASEQYPFLAVLKVDETGVLFDDFRRQEDTRPSRRLAEAVCFVLAEFLTVLGNLTDEILTPALHAELCKVELEDPKHRSSQANEGSRGTGRRQAGAEGASS